MNNSTKSKGKIDKLNEVFDLTSEVLDSINIDDTTDTTNSTDRSSIKTERSLVVNENRTPKTLTEINSELNDYDIISIKTLREDYNYIKESIISNVEFGKTLLNKAMENISGDFEVSPEMIESISSLIKANNSSLKDLSKIYKEIKDIENSKRKSVPPDSSDKKSNTNFIFTGNLQSLLEEF